MSELYPPSVVAPQIRLAASVAHRRGVFRLLLGLLGFAVVYLALLLGCIAAPILLIVGALTDPLLWIPGALTLVAFAPMVFVLVRGFVHRAGLSATAIEVSAAEQPRLFAFLERLAADANAPMPDRVSLGAGVNAAMLRSARAAGLIFGGPRELVIGLGLINTLDLRELKAVLAHELGHFAQSSARLGQWAHRTSVLLREIVLGRDHFDERLARAMDSRSAIVRKLARVLGAGVFGLRRMLGRMLGRIIQSNLALAREMEFNADLHSVALCGSDPIVAALWRAQRGALAMDAAVAALRELGKHGVFSDDLYVHQDARWSEFEQRSGDSLDPMIVALRTHYRYGEQIHFPSGEAPAEVMWYSHPSYAERERNAKREYVATSEQRLAPAWSLFDDQAGLRRRATAGAYEQLGFARAREPGAMRPAAEVEQRIADERAERSQSERYFGFYDNRIVDLGDVELLLARLADTPAQTLAEAAAAWRGPELERFMDRWRSTDQRLDSLRRSLREVPDPSVFELLRVAERDRERLREQARAGDQAVFGWLWHVAGADARAELEQRLRFLGFVQQHIVTLNEHRNRVVPLLDGGELDELDLALAALHRDMQALLKGSLGVRIPELHNLEAGKPVREFLLGERLVDPHRRGTPLREWLASFMPQVTGVHERLRTLHYKNLGRLLALRERIEAEASTPNL